MGRELTAQQGSRGLTEEGIIHIPGLMSRWVRLGDGQRSHYVTAGDTGPAVLLLHGGIVGSSGTAGWRFMAPFLGERGFRVYCPDQPGFGWSDTREEYWRKLGTITHHRFNKAFVDALLLDKVHVSGNSMGGGNTGQFVLNYPDKVINFILIAGGFGNAEGVGGGQRVGPKDSKFTINPNYYRDPYDFTEKGMRDLMAGLIYKAGQIWPELITMRTQASIRQKDNFNSSIEVNKDPNLAQLVSGKERWNKLTFPALYLYGLQDVISPVENGFHYEDMGLPNWQFFYPDDCGHQGQTDQPDVFNQVFYEFFKNGKVTWATAQRANISRRRPINPKLVEEPAGGFPKPDPNWTKQFEREVKFAKK